MRWCWDKKTIEQRYPPNDEGAREYTTKKGKKYEKNRSIIVYSKHCRAAALDQPVSLNANRSLFLTNDFEYSIIEVHSNLHT